MSVRKHRPRLTHTQKLIIDYIDNDFVRSRLIKAIRSTEITNKSSSIRIFLELLKQLEEEKSEEEV